MSVRPVVSNHRWRGGIAPGKRIVDGFAAQQALRKGMATLASAIRPTLGPVARTVAISGDLGTKPPEILDSGALIARRTIELSDPFENMGAMLLRHMLWKVQERAGDGTATTAVLASELMNAATAYLVAGGDVIEMQRGLEQSLEIVLGELRTMARPIDGPARIAALVRGIVRDPELALMIGEVLDTVGPDGDVQIKESRRAETTDEYIDGVRWGEGVASPYFLKEGSTVTVDRPRIFVTEHELSRASQLIPAIEACLAAGSKSLVVIASEIREEALALLLLNRDRGVLEGALALKAPGLGRNRTAVLEDLATIAGAQLQRNEETVTLGTARQAWATRNLSGILGGCGDRDALRARIRQVRAERDRATDEADRKSFNERLGRLTGAAAIIRAGGRTEAEHKEIVQRIEAALAAGRSALSDGVVPGGGAALTACLSALGDDIGGRLLGRALTAPLRAIAGNAGIEPHTLIERVRSGCATRVYDVLQGSWVDPWESGLLDPVGTLTTALDVAVSGVTTALATGVLVRGSRPEFSKNP
jgi:chaperonin GroEL